MSRRKLREPGLEYEDVIGILEGLALDLRLSWNHSAHLMWKQLDPELWGRTRNPIVLLQTISRERLMEAVQERAFKECFRDVLLQAESQIPESPMQDTAPTIAYFSMEYMLTEALPIYSGGLGNVAGDQLKAASDMHVPVAAVGLLFQQGYFRQEIGLKGEQVALFPFNNPGELPISPVRKPDGEWVRIKWERPNFVLWLRAWQATVGDAKLYLLDTNDPANDPVVRLLGSELYGDGPQLRLRQEIILGIGGWRLLRELGINPAVCHLNEGHAAFAILERAHSFMQDTGCDFETALTATRAGNVFTTHTPVSAGFDRFSSALVEAHLRPYVEEFLQIGFDEFLSLGRCNPKDTSEPFNMAYLAMRGCGAVNGVSRVHGNVSRRIFLPLFPRWPETEVPVGHVTNGVHPPTWASAEASSLWNEASSPDKPSNRPGSISGAIDPGVVQSITDEQLWELRNKQRTKLIKYARQHLLAQHVAIGKVAPDCETTAALNPEVLTLVFARRFAEYKRPTLLLHDPARLAKLLRDDTRPVQLIIAGKAHPADADGQRMIQAWHNFIVQFHLQDRVVFLSDYDMHLTQKLVQGADVWINTPRPPWEASGTSGMKVLVNGGLNLSVLDGWWAEAYQDDFGWAVGRAKGIIESDEEHATQIYSIFENEVKPLFYERDIKGVPSRWLAKVRASMAQLTPAFSAHRTFSEYLERYYKPAATAYKLRSANGARLATEIAGWQNKVRHNWAQIRIEKCEMVFEDGPEKEYRALAEVHLGQLTPSDIIVECFAENGNSAPFRFPLSLQGVSKISAEIFVFSGYVPADRQKSHYTIRVLPSHAEVQVPLEMQQIVWEK